MKSKPSLPLEKKKLFLHLPGLNKQFINKLEEDLVILGAVRIILWKREKLNIGFFKLIIKSIHYWLLFLVLYNVTLKIFVR